MNIFNYLGFSGFQTQQLLPTSTICISPNVCLIQAAPLTVMYPYETAFFMAPSAQLCAVDSTEPSKPSADPGEEEVILGKEGPLIPSKMNMRNIIPNIAHKILRFISSDESRKIIKKRFPELSDH